MFHTTHWLLLLQVNVFDLLSTEGKCSCSVLCLTLSLTSFRFSFPHLSLHGGFLCGFQVIHLKQDTLQGSCRSPWVDFAADIQTHSHATQSRALNGGRDCERESEREKRDCACCMFLFCVFTTQTQHKEHTVKRNDLDQRDWSLASAHDLAFSSSRSLIML